MKRFLTSAAAIVAATAFASGSFAHDEPGHGKPHGKPHGGHCAPTWGHAPVHCQPPVRHVPPVHCPPPVTHCRPTPPPVWCPPKPSCHPYPGTPPMGGGEGYGGEGHDDGHGHEGGAPHDDGHEGGAPHGDGGGYGGGAPGGEEQHAAQQFRSVGPGAIQGKGAAPKSGPGRATGQPQGFNRSR
jgi:hypothetical protein